jgi:acyl-CoA thioesterase-1
MSMKIVWVTMLAAALACGKKQDIGSAANAGDSAATTVTDRSAAQSPASGTEKPTARTTVRVLFFGTSLTAGYGLEPGEAFPALIARTAAKEGLPIEAINAGLSGETSAGAVRRISWALSRPVDVVIIETGGNDALRALDADTLRANLTSIIRTVRKRQPDARVLLAVMEAPPNLGAAYTQRFKDAYRDVATSENVTVVPFLLEKVAGIDSLNQPDDVHPNLAGERVVADNVWKALKPVVREVYRDRLSG